jgi:hypothetical protein
MKLAKSASVCKSASVESSRSPNQLDVRAWWRIAGLIARLHDHRHLSQFSTPKIRDPQELTLVIGHYCVAQSQCVSGYEQVVRANWPAGSLRPCSYGAIYGVERAH